MGPKSDHPTTERPHLRLERLLQEVPVGICYMDTDLRYIHINERLAAINGSRVEEHIGRTMAEVLPNTVGELAPVLRQVLDTGEPVLDMEVEAETPAHPGAVRSYVVSYTADRDDDGAIVGVACVVRDVTARRRAEDERNRMVHELDHRVKNILATVLALSEQTMASSRSLESFHEAFTSRLHAMARAHDALSGQQWSDLPMSHVARVTLQPYLQPGSTRVRMSGDEQLLLPSRMTMSLSLVLNELATNAAKYGAFSNESGTVDVRWTHDEREGLEFSWVESHGPLVSPPDKLGFGLRFVRGIIEHEFAGDVVLDFRPEGLSCRFRLAAKGLITDGAEAPD